MHRVLEDGNLRSSSPRPCTTLVCEGVAVCVMKERADDGSFDGVWMAHETGVPLRDAFTNGWGDARGDALD
jgi:hypothetical protein